MVTITTDEKCQIKGLCADCVFVAAKCAEDDVKECPYFAVESAICEANSNAVLGEVSGGINTIILREVQILNFGQALEQLKLGSKVAREGWNGKDMYLYKANQELPYPPLADGEKWEEGVFEKSEFIVMKTADKKLIPWLASQTDLLAEDWTIVV